MLKTFLFLFFKLKKTKESQSVGERQKVKRVARLEKLVKVIRTDVLKFILKVTEIKKSTWA